MEKRVAAIFFLLVLSVCTPAVAQTPDRAVLDTLWFRLVNEPLVIYDDEVADGDIVDVETDFFESPVSEMDSLRNLARDFMDAYRYSEAADVLQTACGKCTTDKDIAEFTSAIRNCRTAQTLAENVVRIVPVDKHVFSTGDFFLYYPFEEGVWREVENAPAIYWPGPEDEIVLSRDEALNRSYPIIDGDRMYFSSKTLPGLGGYDLFRSELDPETGEWGEPVNMGFPINSPADDILFMNTPDRKYSIFSSNRFTDPDSICVYVVEYISDPDCISVSDPDELMDISRLSSEADPAKIDISTAVGNSIHAEGKTLEYVEKAAVVRTLRERLSKYEGSQEGRALLEEQLSLAEEELTSIENDFLLNGVGDDSGKAEVEREVVVSGGAYTFTRKNLGPKIKVSYVED